MKNIISLTTIPSRIFNIEKTINSLLKQNTKPCEIIIWLSNQYKRIDGNIIIPNFILDSDITIKYCEDIGPFTKLFYTLKEEWEFSETNIITVDDDVYYPPNWLSKLIEYSNKNPNSCIGYRGRVLKNKLHYNSSILYKGSPSSEPLEVDIITGTWGALYKPKFFTSEIFNYKKINDNFFVDDLWITGNLAKNNIKRLIIEDVGITPLYEVSEIDSLWSINSLSKNNDKMLSYFRGYI